MVAPGPAELDTLDVSLLAALRASPRAGVLELARLTGVARATVQARMDRLERAGVVTGYGPDVNLAAAGYPVTAFVTLEIAQGGLQEVAGHLTGLPGVLEAWATTGSADVLCRVAAASMDDLQRTLLELSASAAVVRSTSSVALSQVVPPRVLPLLQAGHRKAPHRPPAYRAGGA